MFREVAFNGSSGRTIEPVETPIGRTFVRSITVGEKDRFDKEAVADGKFRARLVQITCCTEDGRLEFSPEDIPAIEGMPVGHLEPIFNAAIRVNHLQPEDAGALRKN